MFGKTTAAIVAALTICSTATWADTVAPAAVPGSASGTTASQPLAPGGAAGVRGAQSFAGNAVVVAGGLAVLGVGIGLIASGGHDHSSLSSTSTPTSGTH